MSNAGVSMLKQTIVYGTASILPALTSLVLLPIYSRYLSTSEFGVIAAMGVLGNMIAIFSGLALDRASLRFYFDSVDLLNRRKIVGTFFIGSIGSAVILFCVLLIFQPLIVLTYPKIEFYPYYLLTLATVTVGTCNSFVISYLRITERTLSYLGTVLMTTVTQAALIFYFVVVEGKGALGQIIAMFISALSTLPVYATIAYRNFTFEIDLKLLKRGLQFSWPIIPTLLTAFVLNWSDSMFIAHYRSMSEVGLYAMAYKISMTFFLITGAVSTAYLPVFFRKANDSNQERGKSEIYDTIYVASRLFIVFAFLLALFSKEIVQILLNDRYKDTYFLVRILLLSHILSAIMGISSNLYYLQSKRSFLELKVIGASATVNLALNYLLVPRFGLHGAALATVLSMAILTIMHYSYSKTCYFIEIGWRRLIGWIGISCVIVFIFQILLESTAYSLYTKILFVVLLFLLAVRNGGLKSVMRVFNSS